MPEAGDFFPGGFSKKQLLRRDKEYLFRFYLETKRGELTHWLSMLPAPLFFLWNSWPVGLCMIGYALLFNMPFICINRYNRIRLLAILNHGAPRTSLAQGPSRDWGCRHERTPDHCVSEKNGTVRQSGNAQWKIV